jgi:hypothetical protein
MGTHHRRTQVNNVGPGFGSTLPVRRSLHRRRAWGRTFRALYQKATPENYPIGTESTWAGMRLQWNFPIPLWSSAAGECYGLAEQHSSDHRRFSTGQKLNHGNLVRQHDAAGGGLGRRRAAGAHARDDGQRRQIEQAADDQRLD